MKGSFSGYERPDGRVGIRNHVLILPTSVCASDVARMIAEQLEGAIYVDNQAGCAQVGRELEYSFNLLSGYAANPNVFGTVLISLGCEECNKELTERRIRERTNKPLYTLRIQEHGVKESIDLGVKYAEKLIEMAAEVRKKDFPLEKLIIATECGGSDVTSGIAANPVVGYMSDLAIEQNATVILSETTEFIGAEHLLAKRAANKSVKNKIFNIVSRFEEDLRIVGEDVRKGNPSPGNREGGITTLEEKSLGCIRKGGTGIINEVYEYGENVDKTGMVIMDTPGFDPASVAGMAAGGAAVCVFTTGRGTPTGHPLIPVIKVCANELTVKRMFDCIDFDASAVMRGEKSIEEQGGELLNLLLKVANGEKTRAEEMGFRAVSFAKVCNFT